MPNLSSSLTSVKPATIRDGNTTGIRLRTTMDMVKKNTIQEIGLGFVFSNLDGSCDLSLDDLGACFSCFLWFFAISTNLCTWTSSII